MRKKLAIAAALGLGVVLCIAALLGPDRASDPQRPAPVARAPASPGPVESPLPDAADPPIADTEAPAPPVSAAEPALPSDEALLAILAVDPTGAPVARVRGMLRFLWPRSSEPPRTFATGDDGAAELRLPAGRIYIDVVHATFAEVPRVEFEVVGGERHELEITMAEPRRIDGVVRDRETGLPVPGAQVSVVSTTGGSAFTDARGRYVLAHTGRLGDTVLSAGAEGYIPQKRAIDLGTDESLDFELGRGDTIIGRVVGRGGVPIEHATIEVLVSHRGEERRASTTRHGTSDPDGRFRLEGIERTERRGLEARAPGHGPVRLDVDRSGREISGVIDVGAIVLPVGRAIEGEVIGSAGTGLAERSVRLTRLGARGHAEEGWTSSGSVGVRHGLTADDGAFRFSDLAPGEYRISLDASGRPSSEKIVHIRAHDPETPWVVLVEEEGIPFRIEVVDELGIPIDQVIVTAEREGALDSRAGAVTDVWGLARFDGFSGPVRVHVRAPAGHPSIEPFELIPADQTERVVSPRGAVVRGSLRAPEGVDLGGLWLRATYRAPGREESSSILHTRSDGTFEVAVPAGSVVDLECRGARIDDDVPDPAGGALWSGALRGVVAPADDLVLPLVRIAADRALSIRVAGPAGEPIAGVEVIAWLDGANARVASTWTDATGIARLRDLPALPLRIRCVPPEAVPGGAGAWLPVPWLSAVAEGQEIAVELLAGRSVHCVVVDADGTSPARATVRIETSTGRRMGDLVFSGSFDVVLVDGETATVEVRVERGGVRYVARGAGIAAEDGERRLVLGPE